jgi:hypothetical protein
VAGNAQSPHVVEVAFASPFDDRKNMVCMPQGSGWVQSKIGSFFSALAAREAAEPAAQLFSIQPALGADPFVADENLLSEISGVRAEPVLVDAIG